MQLENILGTCSMATLMGVNKADLRYNFKDQFEMLFTRFQNGTANRKKQFFITQTILGLVNLIKDILCTKQDFAKLVNTKVVMAPFTSW